MGAGGDRETVPVHVHGSLQPFYIVVLVDHFYKFRYYSSEQ